jgi:phosphomannomutase
MTIDKLIFSLSGIRGVVGKDLTFENAKKIAIAFGLLLKQKEKRVIIGRDTRPSSEILQNAMIEGLLNLDYNILNVGICPTPIIIHTKNRLKISAGIIITGSHNSQEWNGIKLLSDENYLDNSEILEISNELKSINFNSFSKKFPSTKDLITDLNVIPDYIKTLKSNIDFKKIEKENNLKVVIDTGAGTANFIVPQIIHQMGCKYKIINENLLVNNNFPREIEPIRKNLQDLIMEVWQSKFDVGFAFDTDADRVAIVGENGVCYSEDTVLGVITEYYFRNNIHKYDEIVFVTNLASSLMFEVIAEKYNIEVIRTPIGERFLTIKMNSLINEKKSSSKRRLIFGGEGSCGGVIYPYFNNTRDAIFATAKIIEIMVETGNTFSELIAKLPNYYTYREKIDTLNKNIELIIPDLKEELTSEGENVIQIGQDLRFGKEKEWFTLIHPSNTEPIIRVISEAKRESLARIYCETTAALVRMIISHM